MFQNYILTIESHSDSDIKILQGQLVLPESDALLFFQENSIIMTTENITLYPYKPYCPPTCRVVNTPKIEFYLILCCDILPEPENVFISTSR